MPDPHPSTPIFPSTPARASSSAGSDGRLSRIGVCSWSLPHAAEAGEVIAALQRVGIDAVQLALSPLIEEPDRARNTFSQLRDAGVRIFSGMMAMRGEDYSTLETIAKTGGVRVDEHWPGNLEHARHVADLAARQSLTLVTFHAGFIPHDASMSSDRGRIIERLVSIADVFAARNIHLALETGQETAGTLLGALDELDRPNVGVNFDPANMILYGMGDPVAALRLLAPRVRQLHIKDALPAGKAGEWGRETPVGAGAINWPAFFAIARSLQPPVHCVIERERGGSDPQAVTRREGEIRAARDLITRSV